jgi:hypothetical protein
VGSGGSHLWMASVCAQQKPTTRQPHAGCGSACPAVLPHVSSCLLIGKYSVQRQAPLHSGPVSCTLQCRTQTAGCQHDA